MKAFIKLLGVVVILSFTFATHSALATMIVRVEPAEGTYTLGETFSVDLVADIPAGEPVVGWGADLNVQNPSVVSAIDTTVGPAWSAAGSADGDDLAGLVFPGNVTGEGILLATILFSADGIGQTWLNPGITPGDLTEGFALDPIGFADVIFEPAQINVIPEPTTTLLWLMSLGGLAITRQNRR